MAASRDLALAEWSRVSTLRNQVHHLEALYDCESDSGLCNASEAHRTHLPSIHPDHSYAVCREHPSKRLPEGRNEDVNHGDQNKEVIESLLLLSWAVTCS